MNGREALEAAELVEAETRYLHRLAREAYEAGHADGYRAGYRQADADQAVRCGTRPPAPPTAPPAPNLRNGDGDQAAAHTSQTRAPVTSPAGAPGHGRTGNRTRNGGNPMTDTPRHSQGSGSEAGRPRDGCQRPRHVRATDRRREPHPVPCT